MDLVLIRGDTHQITFKIIEDGGNEYILEERDKLYFTVKKSYRYKDYVIQKTMGNGIAYVNRQYQITIDADCSSNLLCGDYVYDIQIILYNEGTELIKTLARGKLRWDTEVTFRGNE